MTLAGSKTMYSSNIVSRKVSPFWNSQTLTARGSPRCPSRAPQSCSSRGQPRPQTSQCNQF